MATDDGTSPKLQLKIHGDLLPVARRTGHARPLGLWALLHALDSRGSGWVDLADVRAEVAKHFTRPTLHRAVKDGAAFGFWQVLDYDDGRRVLRLTGLEALARKQNLTSVGMAPALFDPACLATVGTLRAAYHAALVSEHATHTPSIHKINQALGAVRQVIALSEGDDKAKAEKIERTLKAQRHYGAPISRKTLNTLGSGTRRTQLRYEDRARSLPDGLTIKSTRNLRRLGLPVSMLRYARDTIHGGIFPLGAGLAQRLPDSRATNLKRANRGRVRKVNRALRQSPTLVICGAGERQERRIFFASAKQAERCKDDGLKLVRSGRTNRGRGVQLWDSVTAPTVDSGPPSVPASAVTSVVSTVADVLANWKRVGGGVQN